MGLISLPDPVSMFETWKNAGEEREVAEDILSQMYSDYLTTRWAWRSVPIIGNGIAAGAYATYVSLKNGKLFADGRLRITVPKSMLDPDLLSLYQTEYKEKT